MIGNRLRDLRIQRGLTQNEFASLIGSSLRSVNRWEGEEKVTINSDMLYEIARALNTSVDYLLGIVDDPSESKIRNELNGIEQQIIQALRRGDKLTAINLITSEINA